jgi:fatty-acid desaturase
LLSATTAVLTQQIIIKNYCSKQKQKQKTTVAVLGAFTGQGGPEYWAALHRLHHAACEAEGDPHTPSVRSATVAM